MATGFGSNSSTALSKWLNMMLFYLKHKFMKIGSRRLFKKVSTAWINR